LRNHQLRVLRITSYFLSTRIAAIHEIFGSRETLLRSIQCARSAGAEILACLRDIVGDGPFPNDFVDVVRRHCSIFVKVNHYARAIGELPPEDATVEGKAAIIWTYN
jgi:hypothetical protein